MRAEVRAVGMTVGPVQVARGYQRFDEQPVDGLVGCVLQRERGEVDLLVPELEQVEVRAERLNGLGVQGNVRLAGPLRQPLVELPWRHG